MLQSLDIERFGSLSAQDKLNLGRYNPGSSQPTTFWQFNLATSEVSKVKAGRSAREYYLAVLNPGDETVSFALKGYKQAAGFLNTPLGVVRKADLGQFQIDPYKKSLFLKLEEAVLLDRNLLELNSTAPVVAEVVEYQARPLARSSRGSPLLPGANPALGWYFPYCDIQGQNLCYFKIFNPHGHQVEVELNLYRDWAGVVPAIRRFECQAHSQLTVVLNEELAGGEGEREHGAGFYGSTVFSATAPVVVERYTLQLIPPCSVSQAELQLKQG